VYSSIRFLATAIVALVLGAAVVAPASAQTGTTRTTTISLVGLNQTGARDPSKDAACRARFGALLGKVATTHYNINPQTLIETATVVFEARAYPLNALGLAGRYSMGKYYRPPSQPLNAYGILWSISKAFTDPENSFVLVLTPTTNCLLSSKR
jgi:hypothetical protein